MKRLLITLAALGVTLIVAILGALLIFDADDWREPLRARASEALGREVALGSVGLDLFPMPALQASGLLQCTDLVNRLCGDKPGWPRYDKVLTRRGDPPASL